jgi:hypothetical protein
MKFHFFFILLIIPIIIFSGCSKAECKVTSDCSKRSCSTVNCVDGTCKYNNIDDCCGNFICEDNENKCTCSEDCGVCNLPQGMSNNFETFCDENHDCSNDVKQGISNLGTVTLSNQDLTGRDYKVNFKAEFNEPFNIKNDLMDVEIEYLSSGNNVKNLRISKIEVVSIDRSPVVYAEKNVDKILWNPSSKINEELFFNLGSVSGFEDTVNFNIIVHHEYDKLRSGNYEKTTGTTTFKIKSGRDTLTLLKPERQYYCNNEDCETNNLGLQGTCIQGTSFCQYTRVPNQCGNFICEQGENSCNCPNDCGTCSGTIGDYLQYTCLSNNCVTVLSKVQSLNNFVHELNSLGSHFTVSVYTDVKVPHVVGRDSVKIDLELIKTQSTFVGPIRINKIDIKGKGNVLLGTLNINQGNTLSSLYNKISFNIPISRTLSEPYEKNDLIYEVHYSFNYKRGDDTLEGISTFSRTITNFEMVKIGE